VSLTRPHQSNQLSWRPDLLALILGLIIVVGSLIPADEARAIPGNDLLKHLGLYALLTMLSLVAWSRTVAAAALILIALASLGLTLEVVQPLVGRAFDLSDIAANSAGIVIGAIWAFLIKMVCWSGRKET
jgi:VanZ family protein